ncbi:MAG TPA: hypothetical protein VF748_14860, partial [Candidatus Acidoferrum sp.]
ACLELIKDVERGYTHQWDRSNQQLDFWDVYHCNLGPKQFYSGNSKIFVPICHDAVNARKTRFVNQMFPINSKHVQVTASEGEPQDIMSLLEFYIRKAKLRTRVAPAIVRNGDIEGQYNVMFHWINNKRHVAMRVKSKPKLDSVPIEGEEEFDDIVEETIVHQYPGVEVIPDADLLVLPANAESIEGALDDGGSVTVIRRWSKSKIKQLIEDEEIDPDRGEDLLESMAKREQQQIPDKKKNVIGATGMQTGSMGSNTAMCYETWTKLLLKDEETGEYEKRICRIIFGSNNTVVSCKRNPYWCDKVPILSAPVEKIEGSFKGNAKLKFVESLQYAANDAVNEGMDSAAYALLPIVMTDPAKNPRTGSMVLNVAAVWETDPQSTQFAQFPQLWKEAFSIVGSAKDQIFQTLGINPSMMPQQALQPGKKPNQAAIANEQAVDLLTTADAVTTLEGEIFSPMVQWFLYLDHQFRDQAITVRAFGEMGLHAEMQKIEPIQMDRRFEFMWYGAEAARNEQRMQMQMAGLNMVRQVPPQQYPEYRLNLAPVLAKFIENLFGPRMADQIFENISSKYSLDPEFENELLEHALDVPVQPLDDDMKHMQVHAQLLQEKGDVSGKLHKHMMMHQINMRQKQQAQIMQQHNALQQAQGQPQGQSRPGAKSAGPRGGQQPAGAIPRDQFALAAPRQNRGAM